MATTISLSSTVALALSNTADNPVTVTGGGTINATAGVALDLESPVVWTLVNNGLLAGTAAFGDGLQLGAGGTVDNEATGRILGAAYGAEIRGGTGTVTNAGLIKSAGTTGTALDLLQGGSVGNAAGATIAGGQGVSIAGTGGALTNAGLISGYATAVYLQSGTVTNNGVIASTNTAGVQLGGAGAVTNAATATIAGGWGVIQTAGNLILDNAGILSGTTFDGMGVFENGGGTISNASGGTIIGNFYGVDLENGARTVINAGLITAERSLAISSTFAGSGTTTIDNTGSLIGGAGAVRVSGAAGSVTNAGLIDGMTGFGVILDNGGALTNERGGVIRGGYSSIVYVTGADGTVTNAGTIAAETGTSMSSNAILFRSDYADRLIADPGAVFVGTVNGGTTFGATAVSVLELAPGAGSIGEVTSFGLIQFDPGAAWTVAQGGLAIAGGETISGFAVGDTIQLTGTTVSASGFSDGTLSLFGDLSLIFQGTTYQGSQFSVTNTGGNTDITVACFAAGTRILTCAGEAPVEALRPGMRVVALSHRQPLAVKWIGSRTVAGIAPVRIEAGALGAGRPHQALFLSPDHAVFVGGALIPVRHLVNGSTVTQCARDSVTWFHVELQSHAVLLAEGLPAESYLDTGNRAAFATTPRLRNVSFLD